MVNCRADKDEQLSPDVRREKCDEMRKKQNAIIERWFDKGGVRVRCDDNGV